MTTELADEKALWPQLMARLRAMPDSELLAFDFDGVGIAIQKELGRLRSDLEQLRAELSKRNLILQELGNEYLRPAQQLSDLPGALAGVRSELDALRGASAQYQEVVERAENLLALTADTQAWFAAEDALSEALKPFASKGTSLGSANAEQPSAPASSPWVAVLVPRLLTLEALDGSVSRIEFEDPGHDIARQFAPFLFEAVDLRMRALPAPPSDSAEVPK